MLPQKFGDRDEVKIDAKISVWGTDEEAVQAFAEQIDIQIRRESGAVQIQPNVPKREKGRSDSICADRL